MGLKKMLGRPFGFLFARSQKEELIAEYVVREHGKGRPLAEILEDAYVTNRLTPEQVNRLLDRPEIIQAVGNDLVAAQRGGLGKAAARPAEAASSEGTAYDRPEPDEPTQSSHG